MTNVSLNSTNNPVPFKDTFRLTGPRARQTQRKHNSKSTPEISPPKYVCIRGATSGECSGAPYKKPDIVWFFSSERVISLISETDLPSPPRAISLLWLRPRVVRRTNIQEGPPGASMRPQTPPHDTGSRSWRRQSVRRFFGAGVRSFRRCC